MIKVPQSRKLGKRRKLKYWIKHLELRCTSHNCADVNFLFMLMFEYKYPQKIVKTQETKLTKQRKVIHIEFLTNLSQIHLRSSIYKNWF
jgi:hypothetical protein